MAAPFFFAVLPVSKHTNWMIMQPITLNYVPDYRDIFDASAVLARHRYSAAQRGRISAIVFGAMLLGGLFAAVGGIMLERYLFPGVPGWMFMVLLLLGVAIVYAKVLVPWQLRESANLINAARPGSLMAFTASDDGLRWTDADVDFLLRWSGVEAIYATQKSLSFMSGAIALVLPLSAFATAEERQALLETALSRIPADAAARSRADRALRTMLTE